MSALSEAANPLNDMLVGPEQIELSGRAHRQLATFARELGHLLKGVRAPLFRRENEIVTVDDRTGEVRIMSPERFITWIDDYAKCGEWVDVGHGRSRQPQWCPRTLSISHAKACLQSDQFHAEILPLSRVNLVRMPVMRGGAPFLLSEGYDSDTAVLTLRSGIAVDEAMPIEQARLILDSYYREFGFVDPRSKAVAITMALALFGIGLQPIEAARMGFMVRSNTQGGGKSLIAQMAITPAFGLPENTAKGNDDELRKVLDAAALQGVPYLFFDNLKGHFENALVEGFMTTPVWRARVMGTQRFMRAKIACVLIITGNNLTVSPDLQRRLLQCDLFVEEFDLQEKHHDRDLNPGYLNRPDVRAQFLSALWALIRHWHNAGRPQAGKPGKPYQVATFAEWSDIFGGIVQCAGYGNPLERPKNDEAAAHVVTHQKKLVEILSVPLCDAKPRCEYPFQDLIDACADNDLFTWKLKGRVRNEDGEEWYEPTPECYAVMGLMFTNEMGKRIFSIGGHRVRFSKVGEGRSKRYVVELVHPPLAVAVAS